MGPSWGDLNPLSWDVPDVLQLDYGWGDFGSAVQSGWNWLDDSAVNQYIEGAASRAYDVSGLDSWVNAGVGLGKWAVDPWVDIISDLGSGFKYVFAGDGGGGESEVDLEGLPLEVGGIGSPYIDPTTGQHMYPEWFEDEVPVDDEDTGGGVGDGGVGALMQQLAQMQKDEAARIAASAEDFIITEEERLQSDYDRWEADRIATSGTSGALNRARLDESLEYIGVNSSEATATLADIGIDAEESARAVGGEVGASLYGIYHMGAQLMDNLDRISADTLDQMRSETASDLASGLYQVKENLAQTLSSIDQGLIQYQIGVAQANAAAAQAVQKAEEEAQLMFNFAQHVAQNSAARGGQITDPMEVFINMRLGQWEPELGLPADTSVDPNYRGATQEWLNLFPFVSNFQTIEDFDEFIDASEGAGVLPYQQGGLGYGGGYGFDPETLNALLPSYLRPQS